MKKGGIVHWGSFPEGWEQKFFKSRGDYSLEGSQAPSSGTCRTGGTFLGLHHHPRQRVPVFPPVFGDSDAAAELKHLRDSWQSCLGAGGSGRLCLRRWVPISGQVKSTDALNSNHFYFTQVYPSFPRPSLKLAFPRDK